MAAPRYLIPAGALVLSGALWLSHARQAERLEAVERELAGLREEVRAANARASSPPPAAVVAPGPAAPAPVVPPEAFAARVAELLEERLRAQAARQGEPAAPKPPPALAPEKQPALSKAQRMVDAVLSAGVMRPEDVTELRATLAELGPSAEGHALRQRLIVASNRGELKLPPGVLPFLL